MTPPWRFALSVGPLGIYLGVVACWQGGRRPRVVPGVLDSAMLSLGVGGLLAFGPFGELAMRTVFGRPDGRERTALLCGLGFCASMLAYRALGRLVVYNVDGPGLKRALDEVLAEVGERLARSFDGTDDRGPTRGVGVRVEYSPRFRCAVVEALGPDAERRIQEIRSRLRDRLRREPGTRSRLTLVLYAGAALCLILSLAAGLFR